uniref:SH3 domain-containing protein n=1 Tax=Macaca fascicularis TaxID=9541 RepID=A0A2K5WCN3_MACFA
MPRMPSRPELLVKPALPDGSLVMQASEGPMKIQTLPNMRSGAASQTKGSKIHPAGPDWSPSNADLFPSQGSASAPQSTGNALDQVDDGEVPLREKEKKVRPFSMFDAVDQSTAPPSFGTLRKNQSSEDILRDAQAANKNVAKVPPPVPTKPKQINLPYFGQTNQPPSDVKPDGSSQQLSTVVPSMGTKPKPSGQQPRVLLSPSIPSVGQDQTLSPGSKQEKSPVEIQNPYLHVEPEKEVVSLVPESLSPEDVGSASTENSDMPVASPGLDYEPEGVPDNSPNLQKNPEEPNPESPHLLDVYLEEYPPYPPPPYPSGEPEGPGEDSVSMRPPEITGQVSLPPGKRTNLRKTGSEIRSLEGEFDLVQRIIYEVDDPSLPNDEGITALHNAVCAGHTEIVKFLVQFGVNVNAADSDGWTPLHCAASCNNVQVCKFLVESGAAVFAMTYSDMQTAADKCEEMEEGYTQCSQFLYGVQEKMGIMNKGVIYALWDYEPQNDDELPMKEGDCMTIIHREDEDEIEWWWARLNDKEGYVPRNLLGERVEERKSQL